MGFHQTDTHRNGKYSYHQIGLVRGQFGDVPEDKWLDFIADAGFDGWEEASWELDLKRCATDDGAAAYAKERVAKAKKRGLEIFADSTRLETLSDMVFRPIRESSEQISHSVRGSSAGIGPAVRRARHTRVATLHASSVTLPANPKSSTLVSLRPVLKKPHAEHVPKVFMSYADEDRRLKDRFRQHLDVFVPTIELDVFDYSQTRAGEMWRDVLDHALHTCDLALLLISASFLASRFCREVEVPELLKRREREGIHVVPIILRPCLWDKVEWLAQFQVLPKGGKPISTFSNPESEIVKICSETLALLGRAVETPDRRVASDPSSRGACPPQQSRGYESPAVA